jgi:hypothetical protein
VKPDWLAWALLLPLPPRPDDDDDDEDAVVLPSRIVRDDRSAASRRLLYRTHTRSHGRVVFVDAALPAASLPPQLPPPALPPPPE